MNSYERWILPRLVDLVMRHGEIGRYRAAVVPRAAGTVLEIGAGSGLNFAYYGSEVEQLYALDPSTRLLRMAAGRVSRARMPVALLAASGEALPLPDACLDAVVMTFTLCTIPDPAQALHEMRRVLKPGGRLFFAEHGLAPDPAVQRWQQRCSPLWRRLAGGCNLDRRIDALIAASGFELRELSTGYARAPRMLGYLYSGLAVPR